LKISLRFKATINFILCWRWFLWICQIWRQKWNCRTTVFG